MVLENQDVDTEKVYTKKPIQEVYYGKLENIHTRAN